MGPAPAATPIRRIHLVLSRSKAQEEALQALLEQQQDSSSSNYQHWLTPTEFGSRFGPTDSDLAALTAWLQASGFHDIKVNRGRTIMELSGTAAAVESAFHPDLHAVSVGGETRYTNRAEPQIPAAFAPLIRGIASLNNLQQPVAPPTAGLFRRDNATGVVLPLASDEVAQAARPNWTLNSNGTTYYAVTPWDFASIYDVLPLWNAATPIDGTGESIAVVGDTDINAADFVSFRTLFGLPLGNTTVQTGTQYLNIIFNGPQPATKADESRADSDTQWAAAVAKGAVIDYVASEATEASSGNDLSAAYIVDNNLAPVLVDSYQQCELHLGTSEDAFYNALWQQAAAQGITVVAAAGDFGSSGCDPARVLPAQLGNAVNGIGSTPYNVSVGGTEFYAPNGLSSYFGANASNFGSALGYIPENVWNDTCTNPTIIDLPPYAGLTAEQACNSAAAKAAGLAVVAGAGGGASNCTASNGTNPVSCSGGYAKPSWQSAPGVPADNLRDTPDVSLFASLGRTHSFYVVCQQDLNTDGNACNLSAPYADFAGYGGSELATASFAGMMALAVQKNGTRIGNPNYTLYRLATKQAQAGTNCNATGSPAASCLFHDVTVGTNAMPCVSGTLNCVTSTSGDAIGVLAASSAATGYDTASGLGSVDAANLVNSWASVAGNATSAILSIYPSSIVHGAAITASVTVSSGTTPTPTGEVTINAQADNGAVGGGQLSGGFFSQTFRNLPGGSYGVSAYYAGDSSNAPSNSNFVAVTVTPEPSTTVLESLDYNITTGTATNVSTAPYGSIFYIRANVQGQSGEGTATGDVAILEDGVIFGSGVYRLNSSGYTEAQNNSITPGAHVFSASYPGDPSFNASKATPITLTITRGPTTAVMKSSVQTVSVAGTVTFTATISTQSFGYQAPTGVVTFYAGSQVLGASTLVQGSDPNTYYRNATATLTLSAGAFPIGSDQLTVAYPGDTNYLPSTSPTTPLTVTGTTLLQTVTTVTATPPSVTPTGTVTFAAQVVPATSQTNQPALGGTIQFNVDGQDVGAPIPVSASGAAGMSISVAQWLVGPHSVTAVYLGDQVNYRSSASSPAPFLISTPGVASFPAFTATPTSAVQGTFISVAAVVTPSSPVPTGTVQLVLDGGLYGTPITLSGGAAILPLITRTLQVGGHILTVYYSGDANYASGYAAPASITITAPGVLASSVAIANLPAQIIPGKNVTFSAVITPSQPTPSGILQIILDGGNPGTPILLAGDSTPLSISGSSLSLGTHTVSVFYSGDENYNFSTSPTYSFTVAPAAPVPYFTLSPATTTVTLKAEAGSTFSISYTVSGFNGYSSSVALSCSDPVAYTTCTFAPGTVSLVGQTSAQAQMTVTLDTGITAGLRRPDQPGQASRVPIAFAAILLGFVCYRRTRRLRPALIAALLAVSLGLFSGCSKYTFGTTPSGTYTISIGATDGSSTQLATLNLTVD